VEEAGDAKVVVLTMEEAAVEVADEAVETRITLGAGLVQMNGAIWQKMKRKPYGMLGLTTLSAISARLTLKKTQTQLIMNLKDRHQNARMPIPQMLGAA
jgi:hypothetical protein